MLMGGMTGEIVYEGNLAEFMGLLRFCEQVHIGKQTTFGLGRIALFNPGDDVA
jgi:CRISPR/Cas system endoribonuclease Cas6 (RAMP superfamily)